MSKTYDVHFTLTQQQFEELLTETGNACLAGKQWIEIHEALLEAKRVADAREVTRRQYRGEKCKGRSSSGTPCQADAWHRGVHVSADSGGSIWWEEDSTLQGQNS